MPGILNRQRFQLEMGSHPDKSLQTDWSALGADNLSIEVLDELESPPEGDSEIASDLSALKSMWRENLERDGVVLYPTSLRDT